MTKITKITKNTKAIVVEFKFSVEFDEDIKEMLKEAGSVSVLKERLVEMAWSELQEDVDFNAFECSITAYDK